MEHVDGRSLRDLLGAGELTPETSVRYLLGVLVALEASHRAGVVHRDIKPANVMVTATGAVKLVDFGIAHAGGDPTATVTHVQEFLGTPAYFSPEQARGGTTDARSDLYSAGCLLFELLTGRPPFVGDDPVLVAYQHVHEPAPPAGTGVPALDAVIAKALAKDPDDRFLSAGAFQNALRLRRPTQYRHRTRTAPTHRHERNHDHGTHHRRRREQHPDRALLRGPGRRTTRRADPRVPAGRAQLGEADPGAPRRRAPRHHLRPPRLRPVVEGRAPATTTTPSPPTWTPC